MYCDECRVRLAEVCVASSSYCEAINRLAVAAGHQKRERFADAMEQCRLCKARCRLARLEYIRHQVAHAA